MGGGTQGDAVADSLPVRPRQRSAMPNPTSYNYSGRIPISRWTVEVGDALVCGAAGVAGGSSELRLMRPESSRRPRFALRTREV
jgi:hypothetical protein